MGDGIVYAGLESYRKRDLAGLISRGYSAIVTKEGAKKMLRECYERVLRVLKRHYIIVQAYKSFDDSALYIMYTDKVREYHLYAFYLPLL